MAGAGTGITAGTATIHGMTTDHTAIQTIIIITTTVQQDTQQGTITPLMNHADRLPKALTGRDPFHPEPAGILQKGQVQA